MLVSFYILVHIIERSGHSCEWQMFQLHVKYKVNWYLRIFIVYVICYITFHPAVVISSKKWSDQRNQTDIDVTSCSVVIADNAHVTHCVYVSCYVTVVPWCPCYWLWAVGGSISSLTTVPTDVNVCGVFFCRYPYLTKRKSYFRSWWMKMFRWWERRGLLRWRMLTTLHCLKRKRQRSAKHPILFLVDLLLLVSLLFYCIFARKLFFINTAYSQQFDAKTLHIFRLDRKSLC